MPSAVDLHDPVAADALRQVLVGRPDADLLHALHLRRRCCAAEASASSASSSIIGHTATPIAVERFLQRMELREQCGLDAVAGLVAGPEPVAERFDDVVGRDADVRRSRLDHLQHGIQHADHGAEGPILALGEAAQAVEVAEQLVRAVDEMNDHALAGAREAACALVRSARVMRASSATKAYQALPAKSNESAGSIRRTVFF